MMPELNPDAGTLEGQTVQIVCLDCGVRSGGHHRAIRQMLLALRFLMEHECPELGGGG